MSRWRDPSPSTRHWTSICVRRGRTTLCHAGRVSCGSDRQRRGTCVSRRSYAGVLFSNYAKARCGQSGVTMVAALLPLWYEMVLSPTTSKPPSGAGMAMSMEAVSCRGAYENRRQNHVGQDKEVPTRHKCTWNPTSTGQTGHGPSQSCLSFGFTSYVFTEHISRS